MSLSYLPPQQAFLDPDRADAADPSAAKCVVIPFGLEKTVSYGLGTAKGPAAIIAASQQLELYDVEFECQPCDRYGIATLTPPEIDPRAPLKQTLSQLSDIVGDVLGENKFPFILGGEHALTPGAIQPFAERYKDLVVLQFDAHADLRDGYLGEPYSHAAAMRRALDHKNISLKSLGVRAISQSEINYYEDNRGRIEIFWAKDKQHWNIEKLLAYVKDRPTYITFDIDVLDASAMPATGTPTPGGLTYQEVTALLKCVGQTANVVGADLVELAPIKGMHGYDYMAAELAYKIMSYTLAPS